ncbi:unnamed protein product [Owenia fusiformis]|uniref:Uncharacterized protein n=1 Tax=Owenia fusiformis TaxID=6347 RepID=A0A8S4NWP0_OWEFU|nr:unnamed protein product [Owenia fusiformis]
MMMCLNSLMNGVLTQCLNSLMKGVLTNRMYQSLSFGFRLFESKYCALTKCGLSEREISLFISSQLAILSPGFLFSDLVNMLAEYQFRISSELKVQKWIAFGKVKN